jgi:pterin-4a-carbinolamine dehydratase/phage FluMu protein Com
MAHSIKCTRCGAVLKSSNPIAPGKKVKCPKCTKTFVVEAADEDEREDAEDTGAEDENGGSQEEESRSAQEEDAEADRPKKKEKRDDRRRCIRREWRAKDFASAIEFFNRVTKLAEEERHHPDLHLVGYRNVTIDTWTHAIKGLSHNDSILSAKINRLPIAIKVG